ncbi:UV-endonuclease UvdE [Trametes versicolor FP-101664 SS1]|uniref:UV-endonuclease UvdE n=1 Tax=Trametes versicolor (strain FP-101664) TaxID=717944 RepID=UPI000462419D|nr:UV-endonuclease UvdE [Trametes versicolor FP-101664 SS1]EIW53258.1 UV-endonuclease UvdE [Trametes versicolor FP-101664 SS1]
MANKRKRATRKATTPEPGITGPALVGSPEEARALIRRASPRKKRKVVYTELAIAGEDDAAQESKVDAGFESPLTDLDDDGPADVKTPKKKPKRKQKVKEPVVYDIPPVETKTTTFKGRLGYACLNTILRATKPEPIFCSRTLRIDTILKPEFGMDYCKELGRKNAEDLARLIQWNEENNIRFLRISSDLFPFASHGKYGYTLEYAEKELKASMRRRPTDDAAGGLAKKYGHRLTTHPGQFTQLGSPREVVVDSAIRDLSYHCEMFRYMGLDQDTVMIIHMGGMFGDKDATIQRFKEVYTTRLSDDIKARLVLENDEMCYNADDLLPVCEELNIPIVFDYHHNWIFPSVLPLPELIARINAIWDRKGIKPKQHLSSPCPGAESIMEKRKHADRCYELPPDLPDDMDLMIEAKDKEQAVLHLYRVYNLHPVIHENLRPEKAAKPFPRMVKEEAAAAAAAAAAGGEGEGAEATPTPRKRAKRTQAKMEETAGNDASLGKSHCGTCG